MDSIILLASLVVFIRGTITLLSLFKTFKWFQSLEKPVKNTLMNRPNVYILIPALREQKIILKTLDYFYEKFYSPQTKIVVITTQREFEKHFDGLSTRELVCNYIKEKDKQNTIFCIDYPNKNGIMADQLNYFLENNSDDDSFIVIYNADSMPNPATLELFYDDLEKNPLATVFQQSAIFLNNIEELSKAGKFLGLFLKASAILQSRWTLAHEIPAILRQSGKKGFFSKYAFSHVVGHGLIIKKSELISVGGFPSKTITEDLFLGFLLRSKGINIHPHSQLELANSPQTIRGLWNQKYVWFWGPMKFLTYFHYVVTNRKTLRVENLTTPFLFSLQIALSALAWLVSGPLILFLMFSPFIAGSYFIIFFAYFSIFIYASLQTLIICRSIPILFAFAGAKREEMNTKEIFAISLFSIPAVIFNSIPPYFSLFSEIRSKITKRPIYKPKTDD